MTWQNTVLGLASLGLIGYVCTLGSLLLLIVTIFGVVWLMSWCR